MQWGFWDQLHWQPCSAIATGDDVHPNEAGVAYQNIYNEFVRTKLFLNSVQDGDRQEAIFEFRGFKGSYEIALVDEYNNDIRIISQSEEVADDIDLKFDA